MIVLQNFEYCFLLKQWASAETYCDIAGRYYIKLGLEGSVPGQLTSGAEAKKWFDNGDPQIEENIAKFTASLFKGKPVV